MLVLARRVGETIVIGGDILITVMEKKGESIRLGIEAPRNVTVDRKEVHERRMQFTQPLRTTGPSAVVPLNNRGPFCSSPAD